MDSIIRRYNWQIKFGIVLVCISILIFTINITVLRYTQDTMNYIFNSLGNLPISAFLVTIILNELLSIRARKSGSKSSIW